MRDNRCTIIEQNPVTQDTYILGLSCDLGEWIPGQFVMLSVSDTKDPFLRRPLGILSAADGRLELLYKVVGRGTDLLAHLPPGQEVSVLGPLGNGFHFPDEDTMPIMVAGGTGLPPIFALAERLGRGALIAGARTAGELPLRERMEHLAGVKTLLATDDGSCGMQCLVTELIAEAASHAAGEAAVYACGPMPMLQAAYREAKCLGLPLEVSLEERMGCGFGVCAGCAVRTVQGNRRVCKDGPVFSAEDLCWS